MNHDKEEDCEQLKRENALLTRILEAEQKRARESEKTIQLLLMAGHVKEERVEQARALAKL